MNGSLFVASGFGVGILGFRAAAVTSSYAEKRIGAPAACSQRSGLAVSHPDLPRTRSSIVNPKRLCVAQPMCPPCSWLGSLQPLLQDSFHHILAWALKHRDALKFLPIPGGRKGDSVRLSLLSDVGGFFVQTIVGRRRPAL